MFNLSMRAGSVRRRMGWPGRPVAPVTAGVVLFASVCFAQVFPGAAWEFRTPAELGLDGAKLDQFAANLGGRGCIVYDGYMVKTWGNQSQKADWASAAKPVVSTMLLFAVKEGKLSGVDDLIRDQGWALNAKDQPMTFRHLANMVGNYTRSESPGAAWAYNDYAIQLYVKTLFDRVYGTSNANAVATHPSRLGALQFQDGSIFSSRGGYGVSTSVRDFARIGWFWLNKGNWNGEQLLPESYFDEYMKPGVPGDLPRTCSGCSTSDYLGIGTYGGGSDQTPYGPGIYGFNCWFNGQGGVHPNALTWPDAPLDTFQANGHWNVEIVAVIPSLKLVASAIGNWGTFQPGNAAAGMNQNLKLLAEAVGEFRIEPNGDCTLRGNTNYNATPPEFGLLVKGSSDVSYLEFTLGNTVLNDAKLVLWQDDPDVANPWTIVVRGAEFSFNEATFTDYTAGFNWPVVGTFDVTGTTSPDTPPVKSFYEMDLTSWYNANLGKTMSLLLTRDVQPGGSGLIFEDREGTRTGDPERFGPRIQRGLTPLGAPSNPHPADMSSNASVDTILSWTAGSGATSHKVYFGTTSPPPYHGTSPTGTAYDPGPLELLTTYYWRVEALNDYGSNFGDLWQFTTTADDDPTPSDPAAHNWHAEFTSLAGGGPGGFTSPYASSTGASGGNFSVIFSDGLPSNWLSLVDGTILRFATGGTSSRGRFGVTHTIDPTIGAAVAYRLRMDNTTITRGPFQLCVYDGTTPYNCYVRYDNNTITILNNSGSAYSGIDPYSKPMTGFHDWSLAVRVGEGSAHWSLWIDGERLDFAGTNGSHIYEGEQYSFRTASNSFTAVNGLAYIGLGELNRQSGWEFRYDWVRWTDQGAVYFGEPYLHGHPADEEKVAGETATFSVAAWSGGTVDYQWQVKTPGEGWNNIDGATNDSYTTAILTEADDGNQYRCRARRDDRPYVYSQPATLTVTAPPCEDPVAFSAYSVMPHGVAGDFAIGIDLDEPYAIEPRAGAEHRLEFVFDQEINIGGASVILSSGTLADLDLASTYVTDDTLVAALAERPDNNACLTIEVSGVTDFTGVCVTSPTTLYLTMIQGDLDGSPPVNLTDMSIVRAELYQAVTDDNFMSDVNADGVINLTDLSLVRDNLYQQAVCP